ncbi:hypothetical protein Mgra_00005343 [Meloidogyne graminicola]|uniref:Serpentine receptor class gamma n=1 Tax=Meloidogyne graminicola TaxID=189291 RepID=A0A8S9ZQ06_9BILA|nr:hypothetical protein Mgra_00005343 [Meloidogyne graminicola]
MFFQIAIIIGLNISCTLIFCIMQYLPINQSLILFGYYTNYFVFGLPPIIYLIFNKTIRTDFRKMIGNFLLFLAFKLDQQQTIAINNHSIIRVNPISNNNIISYRNINLR